MGRSRGGLTTKIHAVVDATAIRFTLKLSEGQSHDSRGVDTLLDTSAEVRSCSLIKGYDSNALRAAVASRGAWGNIKPMPNRVNIPAFSPWLYRYRNLVERLFNKLKHFRAIATRFEKHDANYLALVNLTASRTWMRFVCR
jgi:transposase